MTLFVVADRPGVRIFNRVGSARSALELASQRRNAGAAAVFVYDGAWTLIGAPALDAAARREPDMVANEASPFTTITLGGRAAEATGAAARAQGRVRVFRGRGSNDRSGA